MKGRWIRIPFRLVGSVVTRSIPPAAGVPARVIRNRWDLDTVLRHEEMLYKLDDRLTPDKFQHLDKGAK